MHLRTTTSGGSEPATLTMLWCWAVILLSTTTQALNVSLRLTGGPVEYAGRIEVKYNGTWGSVCDDGLDINVGHVICRQLGYPEAIAIPCCNAFGANSSRFWLAGVKCQGNESSLFDCKHGNWGENYCSSGKYDEASVVCKAPNTSTSYSLPPRLSHAPVPYAGCVEVNYAGIWGDIGQFHWNQKNGRVVCRELGYQDVATVLWRCSFTLKRNNKFNMVTWMEDVRCHGNESSLTNCSHRWQTFRSSFGLDAGVVCTNGTETDLHIQLAGATVMNAGRVEVRLAGIWGAIDRYTWELPDAQVACKNLGFSGAEVAVRGATYIFGSIGARAMNIQWIDNVHCLGTESRLHECPHNVSFTPGPVLEAGVVCKSRNLATNIRLAGGNVSYAGRVEVFMAGVWGTVRNQGWNLTASNVACRELGYQGAESAILFSVERFGKGKGPVWISGLKCDGHEESLWKCSWPKIAGIFWDHDNDAGVVCIPSSSTSETGIPTSPTSETGIPSSPTSETGAPSGRTSETGRSKKNLALMTALPVAGAAILLLLMLVLYFRFYRRRRGNFEPKKEFVHMSEVSSPTDVGVTNPGFKETDASYPAALEIRCNNVIDWCEIARERLSLGERIGFGQVGVMFHGQLSLETGNTTDCIVKVTKAAFTEETGSPDDENDLLIELKIMSCLGSHPNILNLFGACTIKGPTYLIFEDAEHGSLLDYLQQNRMNDENSSNQTVCTLSKVERLRIALDVARGMKHIAEKKCIHKDLAARNIRLGKNCVAKVTNIGSSCDIYDRTFYEHVSSGKLPTAKWLAPETLETISFSSQSDIWSFGILLWEIETGGAVPYPDIESKDLLQSLKSGHRLEKPDECSDVIYEVMTKCWQTNLSERPKFSELCMVLDTLVTRETSC